MIGRIAIENYKSIENLTLDLGRVTVLIGANGSGKSNILEAIALCSAAAANKLDNEFLFARGIRVPDDPRHMRSAFSRDAKDIIELLVDDDSAENIYTASLSYDSPLDFWSVTNYEWYDYIDKVKNDYIRDRYESDEEKKSHRQQFRTVTLDFSKLLYEKYSKSGLIDYLPFAPENTSLRRFEEEGQIQPLGIRGEGLFKLLTVLARDENRDRLAELQERLQLLDWFGEFQIGGNVALGERTLRIRDQYLDGDLAYFTQRSANEGFLFLLFYFALFVAKETPRFFAVDNIDASLNPKLCAELLRQLTELAAKYDKQVILTTHNPAVLDGLNLQDDNQRLYVVERDLDGRTQARRVPAPRPPEKHEEPVPLSEAFLRGYIGGLPKNF